jgi:PAS domain S-box-containing protein
MLPIATILLVAGILGWSAYDEHQQTLDRELRSLESNARIAEAQVSGLLRNVEQLLNTIAEEQRRLTPEQREAFDQVLSERMRQFPEIRSLVVIDANGRVELTGTARLKGFDSSQRDYFQAHLAAPLTPNFYISRPFKTASGNDMSIAFSVALRDAQGKLEGMVVAGMNPRYFESVLTQVRPAGDWTVANLINAQGDVIYRIPDHQSSVTTNVAGNSIIQEHLSSTQAVTRHIGVSVIDGQKRLYAIARIGKTKLSVSVARGYDAVLLEWRANLLLRGLIFAAAVAMVLGLARIAQHRQRERDQEARFSAGIIDSIPGLFYLLDTAGCMVRWNTKMEIASGWSADELTGKSALELIAPADRAAVQAAIAEVFEHGDTIVEADLINRHGDTSPHLFSGHRTELNNTRYLVGVGMDISARKAAELELERHRNHLEELVGQRTADLSVAKEAAENASFAKSALLAELQLSNQELEAFSYSVSHDLRAPLRALHGFSHLIEEEYGDRLDAAGLQYLARIRNGAERMSSLIDDLLELARLSRQELARQRIDLTAMATDICTTLAEHHPERSVDWVVAPELVMRADPTLMRVVLENLLRNAWKFSAEKTGARIEVGVTHDKGRREFLVRDNGAGFDMAYAAQLFRPFQRLHGGQRFEGTGIGLAIVQRILARHGGSIRAEAAPEQGATFYFSLPD